MTANHEVVGVNIQMDSLVGPTSSIVFTKTPEGSLQIAIALVHPGDPCTSTMDAPSVLTLIKQLTASFLLPPETVLEQTTESSLPVAEPN